MITVSMIGGLGNECWQYACGRALSLKLGTILQLETSNVDADPKREYSLHWFRGVTAPRVKKPQGQIIEHWGTDYKPELFLDVEASAVSNIEVDVTLRGYWQNLKWFAGYEEQIRKDFVLRSTQLSREAVKMAGKINSCESIGVHVRLTDYKEEATKKTLGLMPPEYFDEALQLILKATEGHGHVFLFSDDVDDARDYLGITKHKSLTPVRGMEENEDLWLMANCRNFIMPNSSYSWWARYCSLQAGVVVAPKNWFADGQDSSELVPKEWIRI